jgi:hypothetical protein
MKAHHTKEKGDLGKLKVKCDLCEKGFLVLDSESEHAPFDLVAYKNKTFKRIQVKYCSAKNGKITISFRTCWTDKKGTHIQPVDKSEIDVYAMYCPDTKECYYTSIPEGNVTLTFRITSPKNNQKQNIRMSSDFLSFPI